MKRFKLAYFILAVGIFIMILNALLGASLTSKYSEINGLYKMNKVSVNMQNRSDKRGTSDFTMDDIKHLQKFSFKDNDMAVTSEEKSIVSYKDSHTEAEVYGVDDKYSMFHQMKLKSGSLITQGNKNEKIAVVDEKLAQSLFNNVNIVGMHIKLYNQDFKIIGVIDSDESIVQTLTDSGRGSIYIPVEQTLEYNSDAKITSFEVREVGNGTTGQNIRKINEALASIGKNTSDYKIVDFNLENLIVAQKAKLCTFIAGIAAIVNFLLMIKKRITEIYEIIKSGLKQNYFWAVLRMKSISLTIMMLEMTAVITLIYLLWRIIKFNLYIPPSFVPDELIDITFFSNLFKSLAQSRVQNIGYVPTFTEMKINVIYLMQNWNLYIDLLVGFPLYYLGFKLMKLKKENYVKHLLYCCIFLVTSIMLGSAILALYKMPVIVSIKQISIIFIFIFISAEHAFSKEKTLKFIEE